MLVLDQRFLNIGPVQDWNIALPGRVGSIAAGPNGEMYLFVHDAGKLYKIVSSSDRDDE